MTRTWRIRRDFETLSGSWLLRYIRGFEKELADPDTPPERRKEVARRLRIAEEVYQARLDDYCLLPQMRVCAQEFEFMTERDWAGRLNDKPRVDTTPTGGGNTYE